MSPDVLVCHQALLQLPDEVLVSLLSHSAFFRDGEAQGEGGGSLRLVASTTVTLWHSGSGATVLLKKVAVCEIVATALQDRRVRLSGPANKLQCRLNSSKSLSFVSRQCQHLID